MFLKVALVLFNGAEITLVGDHWRDEFVCFKHIY